MWVIEDIRRTAAILLALTGLMVVALGGLAWAPVTEDDWLGAMMRGDAGEVSRCLPASRSVHRASVRGIEWLTS